MGKFDDKGETCFKGQIEEQNMFYVTLWFITKGKKQKGKTLFIDARKMGHMVDRKHRDFTEKDIQKLADTFEAFQKGILEDVKGFCSVATIQDKRCLKMKVLKGEKYAVLCDF